MTENRGISLTTKQQKGGGPGERGPSWGQIIGYRLDTYTTKQTQNNIEWQGQKNKNVVHKHLPYDFNKHIKTKHSHTQKKKLADIENRNKKIKTRTEQTRK